MNRPTRRTTTHGLASAPLLALAVLSLAACGGDGEASQAQTRPGGPGGARRGPQVTPVETAEVREGTIAREVSVSGVVEPIRTVGVNSQLSGALLSVNVEEGSVVRAGQLLARLDDRELAAQMASAEAEFNVRRAAFERAQRLRDRQVITLAEYERDRAAYAAAEAALDQLRTRRGYATVQAPVSGVILEKLVEAGDVVANNTRLFSIGEVSTMVVRVAVSELDVVQLGTGEPVDVVLDAFPGRAFTGRIRRVFPAADPATRLVPVEVALGGEGAAVARPGFLARVTFALGAKQGTLLVPASAVVADNGTPAVFVVEDGRAALRTVERGMTSQGQIEILSGLAPGEAVVVAGNNTLRDGAEVRVVSGPGTTPGGQAARGQAPRRGL